jgi:hypothetical protein
MDRLQRPRVLELSDVLFLYYMGITGFTLAAYGHMVMREYNVVTGSLAIHRSDEGSASGDKRAGDSRDARVHMCAVDRRKSNSKNSESSSKMNTESAAVSGVACG